MSLIKHEEASFSETGEKQQQVNNIIPSTSIEDILDAFAPHLADISKRFKNFQIINLSFVNPINTLRRYGNVYYLNLMDTQKHKFTAVCNADLFDKSRYDYDLSGKTSVNIGIDSLKLDNSGKLSIVINSIVKYGVSAREAKKQKIIKYCKENNYYQRTKKIMPSYVSKIAMITTSSGNTESDILNQIGLRSSNMSVIKCRSDEKDIASALRGVVNSGQYQIAVLFRGGNEDEHMLKFSATCVIDEIVKSPIPVASAIGHESDHSIVDDIVDIEFSTPSSFAKGIYAHNNMFIENLKALGKSVDENGISCLKVVWKNNKSSNKSIKREISLIVKRMVEHIRDTNKEITLSTKNILNDVIGRTSALNEKTNNDVEAIRMAAKSKKMKRNVIILGLVVFVLIGAIVKLVFF